MKFWGDGLRAIVLRTFGAATFAAVLVSCGGGEQVEKFAPTRILAFGDENSVIESDGRKYTVNYQLDSASAIDCTQFPLWIQALASNYNLPFPQCAGTATSTPSRILAAPSAKVADVKTQVDNFVASGSFGEKDLVTVMAGTNDVIAMYEQIAVAHTLTEAQGLAAMEQAGRDLAAQVNRVAAASAKVLISTIPDLGYTPYCNADATCAGIVSRLSSRFNSKLLLALTNDGHMIGLILFDESVQSIVRVGGLNTVGMACNDATTTDVRTCTSQTLRVTDATTTPPTTASASTWLWADAKHMSPAGHSNLGSLAVARAIGNPF
jgi:phospholipase/lecithinase/hemolysin